MSRPTNRKPSTSSTSTSPHDVLAAAVVELADRLPVRDGDLIALLRVAAKAMLLGAHRAALSDGDACRNAWTECARSESALHVGLREVRRRRRLVAADHDRLLALLTEACRTRYEAFRTSSQPARRVAA